MTDFAHSSVTNTQTHISPILYVIVPPTKMLEVHAYYHVHKNPGLNILPTCTCVSVSECVFERERMKCNPDI